MNRLFKLKKWLTIQEAARRLSSSAEEAVSEADVLRLGLDGELTLSVDFINHAQGMPWVRVPLDDARTWTYDPSFMGKEGAPQDILAGIPLNQQEVLQSFPTETPIVLRGIYDLTMWGGEALDVEEMYQALTDGPPVELMNIEGVFVKGQNEEYFQILESFEENPYSPGSTAYLEAVESRIDLEQIDPEKAEKMRAWCREQRVIFLEKAKNSKAKDNFYPASGLPSSCRIVVRNESIRILEDKLLAAPAPPTQGAASNSKPSHFLAIAALMELLKEPAMHPRPNGLNQNAIIDSILERFESRGLSKRTLEEIFSAANKTLKSSGS